MGTSPIFTSYLSVGMVQIATANANRDGTGTLGTVVTSAGSGLRIDLIRITATDTTAAGMIRLFIDDTSDIRLWKEIPVTVVAPSASVEAFSAEYAPTVPLLLPSGWILKAGTHNAETFNVISFGGRF